MQATITKPLTIGRLAGQVGLNLETVRYYERQGLLPKPPRTSSGYRIFSDEARRRLRFIKRAQALGFSLREIRELLSLRVSSLSNCAEIKNRAHSKLTEIEAKIKTLNSMKRSLQKLVHGCSDNLPLSECPILESLEGEDA